MLASAGLQFSLHRLTLLFFLSKRVLAGLQFLFQFLLALLSPAHGFDQDFQLLLAFDNTALFIRQPCYPQPVGPEPDTISSDD